MANSLLFNPEPAGAALRILGRTRFVGECACQKPRLPAARLPGANSRQRDVAVGFAYRFHFAWLAPIL